jgi:hypothetical protein
MILKTTLECRKPNVIPVILTEWPELLAFPYLFYNRSGGLLKVYKAIKRYATTQKAGDANEYRNDYECAKYVTMLKM